MLFVNFKIGAPRESVLSVLRDNNRVVAEEKYDTSRGTPKMHIKEKGSTVKIRCEMTDRPTRDNGFLEGTYFLGRLREANGESRISGLIVTAPIYHLVLLAIFVFFVVQCIIHGGINPTPIILLVFSIFMFKDEFRKQPLIKRYIFRALKIVFADKNRGRNANRDRETE